MPSVITLGPLPTLDLSTLPEDQRNALVADYNRGVLDIAKEAHRLHVDVAVLKATLEALAHTTQQVSSSGNSVTVEHSQHTNIGNTKITMGNTDKARSGLQSSEHNWTPYYIIGGIVAIVLIAFLFAGHH
jgi:hypothetical protein